MNFCQLGVLNLRNIRFDEPNLLMNITCEFFSNQIGLLVNFVHVVKPLVVSTIRRSAEIVEDVSTVTYCAPSLNVVIFAICCAFESTTIIVKPSMFKTFSRVMPGYKFSGWNHLIFWKISFIWILRSNSILLPFCAILAIAFVLDKLTFQHSFSFLEDFFWNKRGTISKKFLLISWKRTENPLKFY